MNNIHSKSNKKELLLKQSEELLRTLKVRFEKNMNRHKGLEWAKVQAKLEANTKKLWSLNEMETTGLNFIHTAKFEFENDHLKKEGNFSRFRFEPPPQFQETL